MTKKKLFVIFSSETTLILIHLSHGKRFDTKRPVFKVSHSARGGGLTPNETLSLSNGKFVFDHGPNIVSFGIFGYKYTYNCQEKSKIYVFILKIRVLS